jgi:hypothetical protein
MTGPVCASSGPGRSGMTRMASGGGAEPRVVSDAILETESEQRSRV